MLCLTTIGNRDLLPALILGAESPPRLRVPQRGVDADSSATLSTLPDELIALEVLPCLDWRALCALSSTGRRWSRLTGDDFLWRTQWQERFGSGTHCKIALEAAQLASGWKAFFAAKLLAEKANHQGLSIPTEFELKAMLQRIAAHARSEELDVVFLIDGSGSVHDDDFEASTQFVSKAVQHLAEPAAASSSSRSSSSSIADGCSTSSTSVKVAVVQFSNETAVEFRLTQVTPETRPDLDAALKRMVRSNGGTNMSYALQTAGAMLKAGAPSTGSGGVGSGSGGYSGNRTYANTGTASSTGTDAGIGAGAGTGSGAFAGGRVVVMVTDGRVDGYQAREAQHTMSRLVSDLGSVALYAFGVGRGVDRHEMLKLIKSSGVEDPGEQYLDLFAREEAPW